MNKAQNVMLIVLDTLRADTLYSNLDKFLAFSKLAENGTVFRNAISTASWTVPSHASMFTGMYLNEHGMHEAFENNVLVDAVRNFPDSATPLPEIFRKKGYNTYSVVNNNMLGKGTAFERGFDLVESIGPFVLQEKYGEKMKQIVGEENLDLIDSLRLENSKLKSLKALGPVKALKLARMHAEWKKEWKAFDYPRKKGAMETLDAMEKENFAEPFFSFTNLMEAHEPYHNSMDFSKLVRYYAVGSHTGEWPDRVRMDAELEKMRTSLFSNVENLDHFFKGLINHLKDRGQYENTSILVVSDHGQCFGEHDYVGHGYLLNDYLVNVPMVLSMPGSKREVSEKLVSTSDVYGLLASMIDGESVTFPDRKFIFSESYGVAEVSWKKQLGDNYRKYRPMVRKRIWSDVGYSMLVNGSRGEIEEFALNGKQKNPGDNREIISDLLTELSIFTGSEDFNIPEL